MRSRFLFQTRLKLDEEQQACNTLKVNTLSPDKSVQEFLATEKSPKEKRKAGAHLARVMLSSKDSLQLMYMHQ